MQIPPPATLADLLQDPQRVRDANKALNLLLAAQVSITQPITTRGLESLIVSRENIVIPVPLQLSAPIADSAATAASASTQLNLLLAALRRTGQLPG
jgi:hypothetical protein